MQCVDLQFWKFSWINSFISSVLCSETPTGHMRELLELFSNFLIFFSPISICLFFFWSQTLNFTFLPFQRTLNPLVYFFLFPRVPFCSVLWIHKNTALRPLWLFLKLSSSHTASVPLSFFVCFDLSCQCWLVLACLLVFESVWDLSVVGFGLESSVWRPLNIRVCKSFGLGSFPRMNFLVFCPGGGSLPCWSGGRWWWKSHGFSHLHSSISSSSLPGVPTSIVSPVQYVQRRVSQSSAGLEKCP